MKNEPLDLEALRNAKESEATHTNKRIGKWLEAAGIAVPAVLKAANGHYIDWPSLANKIREILD
jgi:hypothetical protein